MVTWSRLPFKTFTFKLNIVLIYGWVAALTRKKGMMLSFAMACSSRGAPVSDWRPAPHVEKKEPITMTHGVGQARVPTTRFPLTESPNLQESEIFRAITAAHRETTPTQFLTHIYGQTHERMH